MARITLNYEKTNPISQLLYGIFFEDINYGGDGGLYAELIPNRSFGFYDREGGDGKNGMCWELLSNDCGIVNSGYCKEGFAVKKDEQLHLWVRTSVEQKETTKVEARLMDENEDTIGTVKFNVNAKNSEFKGTIKAEKDCGHARLAIVLPEGGDLVFTYISLFPEKTFCMRENGMRQDLAEKLKELQPKFMRFPGGCIVEGRSFANMYNWKDTIGPVYERKTNFNRWQMEEYQQEGRDSSDYFQSYGIGFFEYFQLCEDIGAEPLPVINCGMTCQWHEALLVDLDKLDPFIQDAVDLVEFANGPVDSKWGAVRAEMGHKEPFGLKYIGIGNEQWGQVYFERYEAFEKVLSQKCPDIKLVTCAGWNSEGQEFDLAYDWMRNNKAKAYAVDEHFYKSPDWFIENVHRYDNYDRTLPKVFAGEYASHTASEISERRNNLYAALTEAAFLTGVERNADHVVMASYAPLFARAGHQQWQPDLIWFDNEKSYGSPSYYVQKLFSENTGEYSIAVNELEELEREKIFVSASVKEERTIVKLVNLSGREQKLGIEGANTISAKSFSIAGAPDDENDFENPSKVSIHEGTRNPGSLILEPNEILVLVF